CRRKVYGEGRLDPARFTAPGHRRESGNRLGEQPCSAIPRLGILPLPDEKRRTETRHRPVREKNNQPFTESFSALPGLKLGALLAAIWISLPVWGLRPVRAGRCFTEKVPKPTRET